MTADQWVTEQEALIAAATGTPWEWHDYGNGGQTLASPNPGFHELNVLKTTDDWPPNAGDAALIAASRTSLPQAVAAIKAVLELHKPDTIQALRGDCAAEECEHEELDDCWTGEFTYCAGCHEQAEKIDGYYPEQDMGIVAYPCPTVAAIETALGTKEQP